YPNQELVRKILRYLLKSWTPKVTAIEEAKDLTTLLLEQLLGSLMTHETTMKNHESEETKKKKNVAFRASKEENEDERKRNFKKHIQKGESSKKEEVICYECNKLGHYKSDCPKLKKNKEHSKKKKAMMATWSDSDNSSSDEECDGEVANITIMAIENEDENEVQLSTYLSYDELKDIYDELVEYSENLSFKHSSLKKLNNALTRKIKELKTNVLELEKDKEKANSLEKENESLKLEIDAFNNSDKLDKLLGIQICVFDKAGLGYDEMNNIKHLTISLLR
ncbi:LOW QUALITY PROTEIN: zf-CCHC domain-containing protein/UBN2 domain-containing protein, partial [Cephalotus follicularis]